MKKAFLFLGLFVALLAWQIPAFAAGETVFITFPGGVDTKILKAGDTLPIRVQADVVSSGKVVLKAGDTGQAYVEKLIKPKMWGRAAKLTITKAQVDNKGLAFSMYQEGVNRIALSIWVWPWIKGNQIKIDGSQVFTAKLAD